MSTLDTVLVFIFFSEIPFLSHVSTSIFGSGTSKTAYFYQTGNISKRKLTFQTEERAIVYRDLFFNYLYFMICAFHGGESKLCGETVGTPVPRAVGKDSSIATVKHSVTQNRMTCFLFLAHSFTLAM